LATLMIPFPVTLIPNFLIVKNLGWYDTYLALIVPGLFSVFSTFLLRQYYRGIPLDFDEAARMDGASSLRIWWQIIVPLSGPVLATLAIFVFQGVWNEFLWPLVVTTSEKMRTIPVGLAVCRPVQHGVGLAHGRLGDRAAARAGDLRARPEVVRAGDRAERDGISIGKIVKSNCRRWLPRSILW
jgi:ABC-type glycerol-3-phosphate transport system permease component